MQLTFDMTMRLLVVSRHFWPENNRISRLCQLLSDMGFKIDVICGQPSDENGEFFEGYGSFRIIRESWNKINVFRTFDVKKGNGSRLSTFLNYFVFSAAGRIKAWRLRNNVYDAVFVYQTSPVTVAGAGLKTGRRLSVPVFLFAQDLWPMAFFSQMDIRNGLYKKAVEKITLNYYKKADRLIVRSQKEKQLLTDKYGLSQDRISIVRQFPDKTFVSDSLACDETLLEKYAGSFNVLMVVQEDEDIMIELLFKAASIIKNKGAKRIRIIALGRFDDIDGVRDDAYKRFLGDMFFAEEMTCAEDAEKLIFVSDMLIAAKAPGRIKEYEIPDAVVDHLAAGKPLAVSMGTSAREIIKEGECGFSFEPLDAEGLAFSILSVYSMDKNERNRLGMNASEYQKAHFSIGEHAKLIAELISKDPGKSSAEDNSSVKKLWDI